eukprot:GEMP01028892.1.p1 GENE.GEMP01028892.1~~GEMP01028892.1.p1  ORF type:complete len:447 (+),score=121.33 GEMP01028892.1:114-1454(+)
MAPKAAPPAKALPSILVHEDTFTRGKKFIDAKIAPRPCKGDLIVDDLSIPPQFHSLPELKPLKWFKQGKELLEDDDETVEPSRLSHSASDAQLKPRARKEVLDVTKSFKAQLKNAEKRKMMFMKQSGKIQIKVDKRNALLDKIRQMDQSMNDELRSCRRYVAEVRLFDPVYMYESKFGKRAPRKEVLLMAERSEQMGAYGNEVIDELKKFMEQVIVNCSSFDIGTFNEEVVLYSPKYESPQDPKKGMPQAIKWLSKNFNGKAMEELPPPNWLAMLESAFKLGEPSAIYLACFNAPENTEEILEFMEGKGVPIHCVCFDADIDGSNKEFFSTLSGENGSMIIDTSQRDMMKCDQMMQSVKTMKKQLDKLLKQLDKNEDVQPKLDASNEVLAEQDAILQFVSNDLEVVEAALAKEDLPRDEEGNLILPDALAVLAPVAESEGENADAQ